MAGQWPVEAPPLVADFSHFGKPEILVLNHGRQLMFWAADGTAIGKGQDGLVAQLPAGGQEDEELLIAAGLTGE